MILTDKQTTIAYRCPCCGKAVLGVAGLFTLSADMLRIKCECKQSEMTITTAPEGKLRITVPCLVCPNPHSFLLSKSIFFSDGIFIIPCSYSGIDIAFVGTQEKVSNALEIQAQKLNMLMQENGLDSFEQLKSDDRWDEMQYAQVEDIVRFMLCELDEEGKINCYCKDIGEIPYYDFQILSERVRIFCECCKAEKVIPLNSVTDAEEFIRIDELDLK